MFINFKFVCFVIVPTQFTSTFCFVLVSCICCMLPNSFLFLFLFCSPRSTSMHEQYASFLYILQSTQFFLFASFLIWLMGLQLLKSTLVLGNLKVYVRGFLVSFSFLCSYLQYGHLYFADLRNQSLFVEEMLVFIINYSTKVHKLIN